MLDLESNPDSRISLGRGARRLAKRVGPDCAIVLLGSVALGKDVEVLADIFGNQLLFPTDLAGRGDMSRGGLCLRADDPLRGADVRACPPKLVPRPARRRVAD
ncbi:MAG: hypothetical protein ACT4TC_19885 [Myxococcaceae bacterium]